MNAIQAAGKFCGDALDYTKAQIAKSEKTTKIVEVVKPYFVAFKDFMQTNWGHAAAFGVVGLWCILRNEKLSHQKSPNVGNVNAANNAKRGHELHPHFHRALVVLGHVSIAAAAIYAGIALGYLKVS